MSYSFSVRGASKAEALEKVIAEFDKVVASQPIHTKDRAQATEVAKNFVAVLSDPTERQGVSISVSGSLSWNVDNVITSAGVNVYTSIVDVKE